MTQEMIADSQPAGDQSGEVRACANAALVFYAQANGIPIPNLAVLARVEPEALGGYGQLPYSKNCELWNALGRLLPGNAIGLGICNAVPLSAAGPIVRAAKHAATRRDAMDVLTKYIGLAGRSEYTIHETPDEVRLTVDHPEMAADQGAFTEFITAITYRILRIPLGIEPECFIRIETSGPRLGDLAHYACFFEGVPTEFDREQTVLVLKSAALDEPSAAPDPELFEHLETYLRTIAGRRESEVDSPTMEALRTAVAKSAASGTYDVENLAASLGTSVRSLQRTCKALGVTPTMLIDQARAMKVRQLLADPSISYERAASTLGYTNVRTFRRAVRRWTGQSPREFRAANRTP